MSTDTIEAIGAFIMSLTIIIPFIYGICKAVKEHNRRHNYSYPQEEYLRIAPPKQPSKIGRMLDQAIEKTLEKAVEATPITALQKIQRARISEEKKETISTSPPIQQKSLNAQEPDDEGDCSNDSGTMKEEKIKEGGNIITMLPPSTAEMKFLDTSEIRISLEPHETDHCKPEKRILPVRKSSWTLPKISLLHEAETVKSPRKEEDAKILAKIIQDTLHSFNIDAEARPEDISIGPTIIRFGIRPTGKPAMRRDEKTGKMVPIVDGSGQIVYGTRTRVSRIMALQNDLALALEAKTIRMEAPVPGHPYVGVEIPNKHSRLVTLREVLESKEHQAVEEKSKLAIGLGKDVAGKVLVGDLAKMPHLLIAGATGAGKSVCINTIIASILTQATPDDVRLLMVDPKMVELNMYNGIPHLLSPVVTEVDKVVSLLRNAINEMERRYRLFSQLGVRNLDGYRKLRQEKFQEGDSSLNNLPAIVIIIDELADLMMAAPEDVEAMICRLAQLARATGIHLVVATQRPSVDVITGLIKANIPTRISFMVSSSVDSRTIIDMGGAERLLGRGDMLYLPADAGRPERIQGAFLSDEEANMMAEYWRKQIIEHAAAIGKIQPEPVAEEDWELKDQPAKEFELEDDLLDRAEEIVRENGRASISLLQRRLRIGYTRAARLIDLLEQRHIIGQSESGGRGRAVYDDNQENEESQDLLPEEILEPDISLDELSMLNPDKYFQHLEDILRRTATYANAHEGIIIKESNTTTPGLRATSADSEETRKGERVSSEEWVHAFQYDSGIFWQLNILLRDEKGRTQLHPEHQDKLNQWRKE